MHRVIGTSVWAQEFLSPRQTDRTRLLALYLMTGEHTALLPGLYRLTRPKIATDLGWKPETVDKNLNKLWVANGTVWDWNDELIWCPGVIKAIRFTPERLQAWVGRVLRSKRSRILASVVVDVGAHCAEIGDIASTEWSKTMKVLETHQPHDGFHAPGKTIAPPLPKMGIDGEAVWNHWRRRHPRAVSPSNLAVRRINALLREGRTVKEMITAIEGCWKDEWHQSVGKDNLEYILRDDKFVGFLEGGVQRLDLPALPVVPGWINELQDEVSVFSTGTNEELEIVRMGISYEEAKASMLQFRETEQSSYTLQSWLHWHQERVDARTS